MDDRRITPSRWYYVLATLVFVAGWLIFARLLDKNMSGTQAGLQRLVAPGETELNLSEPGNYTIFYESQSVIGGRVYETSESTPGIVCVVVSKVSNSKVPILPPKMDSAYKYRGRSGKSIFEFIVNQPGIYKMSAEYRNGQQGPKVVLAIGKDFGPEMIKTIYAALDVAFGSNGIAAAIAVVTLLRRSNKKKLLESRTV